MQRRRTPGFPCDPNNVVLLPVAILMVVMVMFMMMPTIVRKQQLMKIKVEDTDDFGAVKVFSDLRPPRHKP